MISGLSDKTSQPDYHTVKPLLHFYKQAPFWSLDLQINLYSPMLTDEWEIKHHLVPTLEIQINKEMQPGGKRTRLSYEVSKK